jgi:hypothetical protein
MALRHSGHSFVVGSGGASPRRTRAISAFMGRITKKYTAAAISRNETSALMKSPSKNLLPLTSNCIAEKSDLPTMAATSGDQVLHERCHDGTKRSTYDGT